MNDGPNKTDSQEDEAQMPASLIERIRSRPFLAAAVVLAVVLAVGILAAVLLRGSTSSSEIGLAEYEPVASDGEGASSDESSGSGSEKSPEATDTADSGDSNDDIDTPSDKNPPSPPVPKVAKIVYRLDGALWASNEDGSAAKKVADVDTGSFALSPDGTHIAYVDAASKTLHIATVASAGVTQIGPAEDVRPVWAPDSSAVAYTSAGEEMEVRTVRADGTGAFTIGAGHTPSFSRDGKRLAFIAHVDPGDVGNVVLIDVDGSNGRGVGVKATEVIWGGDGLIFAVNAARLGAERIVTTDMEGSSRELVGPNDGDKPFMYGSLTVSPDGSRLLYTAHGDDGYSRAFVLNLSSSETVALTVRRDTYPQAWSSDSRRVFFVEGNAFQGEATNLMSALTDGLGRAEVVTGAGL